MKLPDIELVAATVHQAWIDAKIAAGVKSRPAADGREQMVPYEQLDDDLKELDRATVRAVYAAIEKHAPPEPKASKTAKVAAPRVDIVQWLHDNGHLTMSQVEIAREIEARPA